MTLKRLKKAKTEIKKLKAAIFDFLKYNGFIFCLKINEVTDEGKIT